MTQTKKKLKPIILSTWYSRTETVMHLLMLKQPRIKNYHSHPLQMSWKIFFFYKNVCYFLFEWMETIPLCVKLFSDVGLFNWWHVSSWRYPVSNSMIQDGMVLFGNFPPNAQLSYGNMCHMDSMDASGPKRH